MSNLARDQEAAANSAEILKAVAHPLRLRIIAILCERDTNVSEIAEKTNMLPAIVSQQLRILRSHDLVGFRREEGFAVYYLVQQGLKDLIKCVQQCGKSAKR